MNTISPVAWLVTLPQLISRICHKQTDVSEVLQVSQKMQTHVVCAVYKNADICRLCCVHKCRHMSFVLCTKMQTHVVCAVYKNADTCCLCCVQKCRHMSFVLCTKMQTHVVCALYKNADICRLCSVQQCARGRN